MRFLLILSSFALPLLMATTTQALKQPLPMDEAFRFSSHRSGENVVLSWKIEDGYYLYRDYLSAKDQDGQALKIVSPAGKIKEDPGFGATEVYYGAATATIEAPPSTSLEITYQGCEDGGLCYPPTTQKVDVASLPREGEDRASGSPRQSFAALPLVSDARNPEKMTGDIRVADTQTTGMVEGLIDRGGVVLLLAAFLGLGVLLAFTPCVFPMYPILAASLAREGHALSIGRGFALSSVYVLALATAFSIFGVLAAWSGQSFQIALQSPAATAIVVVIFIALALSSFGLFELQLPSFLTNGILRRQAASRGSLSSSAVLGFTSALIIGPCVTAPLAGALLYIAQTGDLALGAAALFALGVGKGIPLIVMGTFGAGLLPRAGRWMERVRQVFGFLFLATAIWLADRLLPAAVALALWSTLLVTFGVFMGAFEQLRPDSGGLARLAKSAGLLASLYGGFLAFGSATGASDPLKPLAVLAAPADGTTATPSIAKEDFTKAASTKELAGLLDEASAAGEPSLVYFTADWCVTCRVIDRSVLPDAKVTSMLRGVRLITVDLSEITAERQALMNQLKVVGPPTMLFFDGDRAEVPSTRLVGEISADGVVTSAMAAKGGR